MRNVELDERWAAKADVQMMCGKFTWFWWTKRWFSAKLPDYGDAIVVTWAIADVDADERRRKGANMLLLLHPLLDQSAGTVAKVLHIVFVVLDCRKKL
jgi:hypothetical protein